MKPSPEARCEENVRRWFAETNGPTPTFIGEVQALSLGIRIAPLSPTRALIEGTPAVISHLRARSRGTWMVGTSLPDHCICGKPTDIDGGREYGRMRYALQWIQHEIVLGPDIYWNVVEIDFDGFNPNEGILPAGLHIFIEWFPHKFFHKQTNPYTVAKRRGWDKPAKEAA